MIFSNGFNGPININVHLTLGEGIDLYEVLTSRLGYESANKLLRDSLKNNDELSIIRQALLPFDDKDNNSLAHNGSEFRYKSKDGIISDDGHNIKSILDKGIQSAYINAVNNAIRTVIDTGQTNELYDSIDLGRCQSNLLKMNQLISSEDFIDRLASEANAPNHPFFS